MTHGSLFSGIGGFDLAADWAGWRNIFHCEIDLFGQKILKHYWPEANTYEDITKTDFTKYRGAIDVLSGGFPCQPYSLAGLRKGTEDARHLWPEMLRAIREIRPRWVVGENVRGIVSWNDGMVFEEVQTDLEAEGYEVQPYVLPAAGIDAPHQRQRVWFIAYSTSNRRDLQRQGICGSSSHSSCEQSEWVQPKFRETIKKEQREPRRNFGQDSRIREQGGYWQSFPTQSPVHYGDDGFPSELDGITFPKWRNETIKAGGNAIVPQMALNIFKAINTYEEFM